MNLLAHLFDKCVQDLLVPLKRARFAWFDIEIQIQCIQACVTCIGQEEGLQIIDYCLVGIPLVVNTAEAQVDDGKAFGIHLREISLNCWSHEPSLDSLHGCIVLPERLKRVRWVHAGSLNMSRNLPSKVHS